MDKTSRDTSAPQAHLEGFCFADNSNGSPSRWMRGWHLVPAGRCQGMHWCEVQQTPPKDSACHDVITKIGKTMKVFYQQKGKANKWLRCVSHLLPLDRFWVQEWQQ
jgi:hypothetical protein